MTRKTGLKTTEQNQLLTTDAKEVTKEIRLFKNLVLLVVEASQEASYKASFEPVFRI